MIDWHSHVLPAMDDGSRDISDSLALLRMLSEQGSDTVVATPHFYPNRESVASFIRRRDRAMSMLTAQLSDELPKIIPGAEVLYYEGISRLPELELLRIQGTDLLLLEMPMARWSEYTVRELVRLSGMKNITLVVAHVERYMRFQSDETMNVLYNNGILMQVNASFFCELWTRRTAVSMLWNRGIHFIGSDCHNLTSRPPRIGKAFDYIEKKLGKNFLSKLGELGNSFIAQK